MKRPESRWPVLLAVVLLHLLLALVLRSVLWRSSPLLPASPSLQWVSLPPLAAPAAQPTPMPERRPVPRPRTLPAPAPPSSIAAAQSALRLVDAEVPAPQVPASAASAPRRTPLMDSEATRRAIREAARQPLLDERVERATGMAVTRTDQAITEGVAQSLKPDCLQPQASGAGLLALPGLVVMAVTGQCAR